MNRSVWIGWDSREAAAFAVAKHSIRRRMITPIPIHGVVLSTLRAKGLYTRPTSIRDGRLWDDISEAPMSTEFSNSRFLVPHLVKTESRYYGQPRWALFMDCDMLVRSSLEKMFALCDPSKAAMVVKHDFRPPEGLKMDGQKQVPYHRKLWSSFCAFNVDHPANAALTPTLVNSIPGRNLHALCWLEDDQIGELDMSWNWIPGHNDPEITPDVIHWSEGGPWFNGFNDVPYADDWRAELEMWAA